MTDEQIKVKMTTYTDSELNLIKLYSQDHIAAIQSYIIDIETEQQRRASNV
jgi:hypothetical protein